MVFVRNNRFFLLLSAGALLLGVLFLHMHTVQKQQAVHNARISQATVTIGGAVTVPVTVADTPETRERGLSGTSSLPEGSGMLFMFDTPDMYGFWMKDMKYPLDIIWIDQQNTVVSIAANTNPDTYPHVFYPNAPATKVLEVESGFSTAHGLKVGQSFTFQK